MQRFKSTGDGGTGLSDSEGATKARSELFGAWISCSDQMQWPYDHKMTYMIYFKTPTKSLLISMFSFYFLFFYFSWPLALDYLFPASVNFKSNFQNIAHWLIRVGTKAGWSGCLGSCNVPAPITIINLVKLVITGKCAWITAEALARFKPLGQAGKGKSDQNEGKSYYKNQKGAELTSVSDVRTLNMFREFRTTCKFL